MSNKDIFDKFESALISRKINYVKFLLSKKSLFIIFIIITILIYKPTEYYIFFITGLVIFHLIVYSNSNVKYIEPYIYIDDDMSKELIISDYLNKIKKNFLLSILLCFITMSNNNLLFASHMSKSIDNGTDINNEINIEQELDINLFIKYIQNTYVIAIFALQENYFNKEIAKKINFENENLLLENKFLQVEEIK